MSVEVNERFGSPRITTGSNPGVDKDYTIEGTDDEVEAHNALLVEAPIAYDPWGSEVLFLPRTGVVGLQQVGPELYEATVHYSAATPVDGQVFEFDTTGGIVHRACSIQTVAKYARPGKVARDFKGLIGVNGDTVDGVDVPVPAFAFSVTRRISPLLMTPEYIQALKSLTGSVNSEDMTIQYQPGSSFLFKAGELRFRGAVGGLRGIDGYSLTFHFEESDNAEDIPVGDIVGPIPKLGWDYLWIRFMDDVDAVAKGGVKVPSEVYIEQVSPTGDLRDLGLLS